MFRSLIRVVFGVLLLAGFTRTVSAQDASVWFAGVGVETPELPGLSDPAARVTFRKLPSGVRWNRKTRRLEGAPSKAGSFAPSVTVKGPAGSQHYTFPVVVEPLPSGVAGNFDGAVVATSGDKEETVGQISLKVSSRGAVSGRILSGDGKSCTVKAASYSRREADGSYVAEVTVKKSGKTAGVSIVFSPDGTAASSGRVVLDGREVSLELVQNLWKRKDLVKAKAVPQIAKTLKTTVPDRPEVTVSFKAKGLVTASGRIDGVKVSGKAQLLCRSDWAATGGAQVVLFFKSTRKFSGFAGGYGLRLTMTDGVVSGIVFDDPRSLNTAALMERIRQAPDGSELELAPGEYGPLDLSGVEKTLRLVGDRSDPSAVVIRGTSAGRAATLCPPPLGRKDEDGEVMTMSSLWGYSPRIVLESLTVTGGTADYGGGVLGGRLVRCVVKGNTATVQGGGACGSVLQECLVVGNRVVADGLEVSGYGYVVKDLEHVPTAGGAVHCGVRSSTVVDNDVVLNGVSCAGLAPVTVVYSAGRNLYFTEAALQADDVTALNSLFWGGAFSGASNYRNSFENGFFRNSAATTDPEFADGTYVPTSALIVDGGDDRQLDADDAVDLAGNARLRGAAVDIGCYETEGSAYRAPDTPREIASAYAGEVSSGGARSALCVGVCKYSREIGGADLELQGCVNDARGLAKRMVGSGLWPAEDVTVVLDRSATKAAVRAAVSAAAERAAPGDLFVYTHSSHGMADEDSSGRTLGGSTLLCHDAGYSAAELAADIAKFPRGARVVLVIDACHSGGLFKTDEASGAVVRSVRPGRPARDGFAEAFFEAFGGIRAAQGGVRALRSAADTISASDIAFITAADFNELSVDAGSNGEFTGALLAAWNDPAADLNGDGAVSFYEIFVAGYETARGDEPGSGPGASPCDAQCSNAELLLRLAVSVIGGK